MKNLKQSYTRNTNIRYTLDVTEDTLHKVRFLCKQVPNNEWSGILLYKEIGERHFQTVDIIPMDIGSSSYTEYNYNKDSKDPMIDYFEKYPELLSTCKIGHIHSHNMMETFFSHTDIQELKENSGKHDLYLSLIVNNWLNMTAKAAKNFSDSKVIPFSFNGEEEKFNIQISNCDLYEVDINTPFEESIIDSDFVTAFSNLKATFCQTWKNTKGLGV